MSPIIMQTLVVAILGIISSPAEVDDLSVSSSDASTSVASTLIQSVSNDGTIVIISDSDDNVVNISESEDDTVEIVADLSGDGVT